MIENKQLTRDLLKTIEVLDKPLGALYLSKKLNTPSATIGRLLLDLEYHDYLKKVSNKGRILTPAGAEYLKELEDEINTQESVLELYRLSQCSEKKTVLDMLYARRTIEMATASLAAERITEKQLNYLEYLTTNYNQKRLIDQKRQDINRNIDISFDFHLAIAHISDNQSYVQILKLLLTKNGSEDDLVIIAKASSHMPNYHQHSSIINALRSHDRQLSAEVMKKHIDTYIDYINETL